MKWPGCSARAVRGCSPSTIRCAGSSRTIPGPPGLTASLPYFDRTPYVEVDGDGVPTYVEHHRTIGDRVREIVGAGLEVATSSSRSGPNGSTAEWGQWSPLRGQIFPGTAIFSCRKPVSTS